MSYVRLAHYELREEIGSGQYGVVKLAHSQETNIDYAMKIISKKRLIKRSGFLRKPPPRMRNSTGTSKAPSSPLDKIYREIALLKKLDHPNIVKLIEVLDEPNEDILYMVFELMPKGESLQIPNDNPLDEDTSRRYFRDALQGLDYLHFQHIIHRDIKPANLLLDIDGHVKISDLGVSVEVGDTFQISGQAGTPAFLAPEILNPDTSKAQKFDGVRADLWALGITLYCFLSGTVPWNDMTHVGIYSKIMTQPIQLQATVSEDCLDLIKSMLEVDPDSRPTMSDLYENVWVLASDGPLKSRCSQYIEVTEDDINSSVTVVPKLETLIMVKQMLKRHSFRNPFLSKKTE